MERLGNVLRGIGEGIAGNPLPAALLAIAALLIGLFVWGIVSLQPSSPGRQVALSEVTGLLDGSSGPLLVPGQSLAQATLRDQDARVEVQTAAGDELWASYPKSDAFTSQLLAKLNDADVPTVVDQQSGKPTLHAVVQFLLP